MGRVQKRESPWLFQWRKVLLSEAGPTFARRHVLNVLAGYGDEHGNEIFPSTDTLARATGMSRRRVEEHLRKAEADGWIERTVAGSGRGWRRMTYTLHVPKGADGASGPRLAEVRTERPDLNCRRADDGGTEVRTERPITSLETSPSIARNRAATETRLPRKQCKQEQPGWTTRAGDRWRAAFGGVPNYGKIGRHLKPLVDEHRSVVDLTHGRCSQRLRPLTLDAERGHRGAVSRPPRPF